MGGAVRWAFLVAVLGVACGAALPSRGDDSAVNLGKRRAAASDIEWDLREANHPVLGPVRFTARKTPAVTPSPGGRIVSQAYVSCQKQARRIAIELTNALESNLAGGLGPKQMPRLTCYSTDLRDDSMGIRELDAKWATNELGDALARGLAAADLRRCISIEILQEVVLPAGASPPTQRVVLELLPFDRAFDAVAVACGEKTAYGAVKDPPVASAPPAAPVAAPSAASPPAPAWRNARTAARGQTNVRAGPGLEAAIVRKLDANTRLQAQHAKDDWWRVRPTSGAPFSGYVREDRLQIE